MSGRANRCGRSIFLCQPWNSLAKILGKHPHYSGKDLPEWCFVHNLLPFQPRLWLRISHLPTEGESFTPSSMNPLIIRHSKPKALTAEGTERKSVAHKQ